MNQLEAASAPLLGVPCWQVTNFHGSMLMIEFGAPSVEIGEPAERLSHVTDPPRKVMGRHVSVHGEWTLTITLCEWELSLDQTVLAHSESAEPTMARALRVLSGQALVAVDVDPDSGATEFRFDLGAVLHTRPVATGFYGDEPVEQWTLRLPDNRYLAVRDDGMFHLADGHADPATYVWTPLRS